MVLQSLKRAVGLGGPPLELLGDGSTKLPDYFPVEPKGCEKHSARLFECLAGPATEKAREMEKAGLHKSWYPDVTPTPGDEKAAQLVKDQEEKGGAAATAKTAARRSRAESSIRPMEEAFPAADDEGAERCSPSISVRVG